MIIMLVTFLDYNSVSESYVSTLTSYRLAYNRNQSRQELKIFSTIETNGDSYTVYMSWRKLKWIIL